MNKKIFEEIIKGAITIVLFILIFCMMHVVSDIQGTARVVNYAGLVRGETQRVIKLEIVGGDCSDLIDELDMFVDGIKNGSVQLNLVKIEDRNFQLKAEELSDAWETLKSEVEVARQLGYEQSNIVAQSESYFALSDEVVDLAESYSQKCATYIRYLEIAIVVLIFILLILMLKQSLEAITVRRTNRELQKKVYDDEQTGLPNKNKCAMLLEDSSLIETPTACMMFDLNNLKYVNDNLGHDAGDLLICNFANQIRKSVPKQYFVGRYGGDEFIVILTGEGSLAVEEIIQIVQHNVDEFNQSAQLIPISYAVGYSSSEDFEVCTLRILLSKADKNMYINKRLTKENAKAVERNLEISLTKLIEAFGKAYVDCCYCNARTGMYRVVNNINREIVSPTGVFKDEVEKIVPLLATSQQQQEVSKKLDIAYIKAHLSEETPSYEFICQFKEIHNSQWWRVTVMYVDQDELGELLHFMLLFEDITSEVEIEYEAKHDGMTNLWNKTAAFFMIQSIADKKENKNSVMMMLDIDHFKQINDSLGHDVGDQVIKDVAILLQSEFKEKDIVARFGGDEFLVFINEEITEQELKERAQGLVDRVHNETKEKYQNSDITISVGLARMKHGSKVETAFQRADQALYEAKKNGRNTYVIDWGE